MIKYLLSTCFLVLFFASCTDNSTPVTDALSGEIANYLRGTYLDEREADLIPAASREFEYYQTDLNGDGKEETLVSLSANYFCGSGGCTFLLLSDDLQLINEFTVTSAPIYIMEETENDWRVLSVRSEGNWKLLTYTDGSYPSNPSVVEKTSAEAPGDGVEVAFGEGDDYERYSF